MQALEAFIRLGQQLAGRAASANFQAVTARSSWTRADVETETEHAIERMKIGARDLVVARGADPDDMYWRMAWIAMEIRYRDTMANLLRISGLRGGSSV
ncbi:hypothetical protein MKK88_02595 [Methylobacterium sp. E-005]|uniref:hypothetical protein n=1 Tax=Methylobacterium sp. E-005 TaxID=2836549 RepID=UPI001FBAA991|nr:hypothetical protein [Methylobacterium sp. E-005]MCJ2084883.1 hypothetical protein [Methylobacterium sp. E-005]